MTMIMTVTMMTIVMIEVVLPVEVPVRMASERHTLASSLLAGSRVPGTDPIATRPVRGRKRDAWQGGARAKHHPSSSSSPWARPKREPKERKGKARQGKTSSWGKPALRTYLGLNGGDTKLAREESNRREPKRIEAERSDAVTWGVVVCRSIHSSFRPPVHPSVHPSIHPSIQPTYLPRSSESPREIEPEQHVCGTGRG